MKPYWVFRSDLVELVHSDKLMFGYVMLDKVRLDKVTVDYVWLV